MQTRFKFSTDIVDHWIQYIFEHDDLTHINKSEHYMNNILQLKFKLFWGFMDEFDIVNFEQYIALMSPELKAKVIKDMIDWGQEQFIMISQNFPTRFKFIIDHLILDSVGILINMETVWCISSQSSHKYDYFTVAVKFIKNVDEQSYKHFQNQVYNWIASIIWTTNRNSMFFICLI